MQSRATATVIPSSSDDLTAEFLSDMLGGGDNAVESVELEALPGLLSRVYRARLVWRPPHVGKLPDSVIVKFPLEPGIAFPPGSAYERELRFYEELAELSSVAVPTVYYSRLDVEAGKFVLVLQDFPAHRQVSELDGSDDRLRATLEAMAKLHARWWENSSLADISFLRTHADFIDRVEWWLAEGVPRFLARFEDVMSPDERRLVEALAGDFRRIVEPLTGAPITLVHHDLSLRNVLFGDEPSVVLIDWQLARRSAAVRDLSYFVGTSLSSMDDEPSVLAYYHERLVAEGVGGYTVVRMQEDYARSVVCDFGRMVMTAGQERLAPAMADIVAAQLRRRCGAVAQWALMDLG